MPQRVEVVFTGTAADLPSGVEHRFEAPALGDLPVAETLWTVVGPAAYGSGELEGGQPLSPEQYEVSRLRAVSAMIQLVASLSNDDPQETLEWFRPWARRLVAVRRLVEGCLVALGDTEEGRAAKSEVHAIDEEQSKLADRLGALPTMGQISAAVSLADSPTQLWHWSLDRPQPAVHYLFREGVSSITLAYRSQESGGWQNRLLLAVVLITLMPLLVFGLRRSPASRWWKRWPHAAGVGAGLAWWLWLSPSLLGWGIVLLSIAASLRAAWNRSSQNSSSLPS
jgi:hypothetical protein